MNRADRPEPVTDRPPPSLRPTDGRGERLRKALAAHPVVDDREAGSVAAILAALDRLDHPFDRRADLTHFTASGIVTGSRGVVLHRHRVLDRWLQPGGHVEDGEDPEAAVVRECVEETGLAVAHPAGGPILIHVDVHPAARAHVHLDLRYLLTAPDDDPSPGPGESQEVAWFTWDDADGMADEALAGALVAARRLIGADGGVAGGGRGRAREGNDG